jgi:type IV pilus assembly protein PilC
MKYVCTAYDRAGKATEERIEAATPGDALETMRRRGLFPVDAKPEALAHATRGTRVRANGPNRLRRILSMTRQMSVLVSTGTPVAEALQSLERQSDPGPWKNCIADVRKRVESGEQLSAAMSSHPRWFDPVAISMIAAGESGGHLDTVLQRLHDLTRQQVKLSSTLRGAMAYPIMLMCLSLAVMGGMIGFVLPRFEGLFKTLDTALPPTTKIVMAVSHAVQSDWPFMLGGVLAFVIGSVLYCRSAAGIVMTDNLLVWMPGIRTVVRSIITARLTRILGVLLDGRVPMLEALTLTRAAAGNQVYADLIDNATEVVTRGESLAVAFAKDGLMGITVVEAVRSGERSGQVAKVLLSVSDSLDEENEVLVKTITSLLEPVILSILGLVVGFVAIGMFLPLFDLTAAGSGPAPGGTP